MEILMMEVTPQLAGELLAKNNSNRRVRPNHVANLANDMRMGKFQATHQGVAINPSGELVDGQHRLLAVVKSGVTVKMPVAFGVNAENYRALMIDVGVSRSMSDLYGIDRFVAQPCAWIAYLHTSIRAKSTLPPYLDAFGAITQAVTKGGRHMRRGITSAPFIAAAAVRVAMGEDPLMVNWNFSGLVRLDYESLPPVANAFLRQLANGVADRSDKWDLFIRGMRVFDASAQQNTKIQIKDGQETIASTREFIGKFIVDGDAIRKAQDRISMLSDDTRH